MRTASAKSSSPLLVLRAVRLAQFYGFEFSPASVQRLRQSARRLRWVPRGRLREHVWTMAGYPRFDRACEMLMRLGALGMVFPGIDKLRVQEDRRKDMWEHTIGVVRRVQARSSDPVIRLTALLHDIGKPMTAVKQGDTWTFYRHEQVGSAHARHILERLGIDAANRERICQVIALHQIPMQLDQAKDRALRRFKMRAGKVLDELLLLASCDWTTQDPAKQEQCTEKIRVLQERLHNLQDTKETSHAKDPQDRPRPGG